MDVIPFSCYPLVLNLKGGNMEERQVVDEYVVTVQVDDAIDSMKNGFGESAELDS
jgi:hypothetical protein